MGLILNSSFSLELKDLSFVGFSFFILNGEILLSGFLGGLVVVAALSGADGDVGGGGGSSCY